MTPTLDWQPFKDPASLAYPVRAIIGPTPRYRRMWTPCEALNQGHDGKCTGYASAMHLGSAPAKWKTDVAFAERIFSLAEQFDKVDGRDYGGAGATVLAAMKAGQSLGYFDSYVWAFGIDDVIDTIVRKSPVLLGIPWYPSMSEPDNRGLLTIGGGGPPKGHCIMANGFWPSHPDFGNVIVLTNTWGSSWGINGRCYLKVEDAKRLIVDEQGEVAVPHEIAQQPTEVPPEE